jgi:hypothetical protein
MTRFFSLLGVVFLAGLSIGQVSAATIYDDIIVSYSSSVGFDNLSLSLSSPSTGNLITGTYASPGASVLPGAGTLLNEVVAFDTTQKYTLSVDINAGDSGGAFVIHPATSHTFSVTLDSSSVSVSVSPVPLPASFPLFAMAIFGLAAFGYYAARTKTQIATAA